MRLLVANANTTEAITELCAAAARGAAASSSRGRIYEKTARVRTHARRYVFMVY